MKLKWLKPGYSGLYAGITSIVGVILINSYNFIGIPWLVAIGIGMLILALFLGFKAVYTALDS